MVNVRTFNLLPLTGYYLEGWPSAARLSISVCNQPPRSTQPSIPTGR